MINITEKRLKNPHRFRKLVELERGVTRFDRLSGTRPGGKTTLKLRYDKKFMATRQKANGRWKNTVYC